jgi:mannose-6-phosphate isomerase-like protein (cupin superfamily)
VVARAGDFFVVPPHTVHREGNPGSEEQVLVRVRVGSGPTVINVERPDPA